MPQVVPFVVGFVQGAATAFGGTAALSVTASSATVAGYAVGSHAITGFILKTAAMAAVSGAATKIAMGDMGSEGTPSSLSNVMDPMPSSRTIYGKTKTGGVIVFAKATKGYTSGGGTTNKNQILHMVIELAGHPCESIDEIYLGNTALNIVQVSSSNPVSSGEVFPDSTVGVDDEGVKRYTSSGTDYDGEIGLKVYTGAQQIADDDLVEATTLQGDADKWTTDHVGFEKTYVYIRLHFKSQLFRGIPKFTFDLTGKNTVSFLGQTEAYTANPIKCLYDYMTMPKERGGFGVDTSDIDNTAWQTAADKCDVAVEVYDDETTQPRYFCGGIISAGQEPHSIIRSLLDACAGVIEWVGGKWYVWTYTKADITETETYTITESELIDFPVWQLNRSAKDAVNSIKPVIRSIETAWQPSEVQSVEALRKLNCTSEDSVISSTAHGLEVGDRVKFIYWDGSTIDNSSLPTNIKPEVYYYVVSSATDTFQVSATAGGGAISIGTTTSGLTALHDIYLSIDGERRASDMVFTMVNDETMARRLAVINLRQARQEISGRLLCKPGTAFCAPADLFVGDTIRILNQELSFYEVVESKSGSVDGSNDTFSVTSHGLNDGKAVTVSGASAGTGLDSNRIYYVRDATPSTFKICEYRGGPPIDIGATDFSLTVNEVQGKLFRVVSYRPIISEGIFSIELGVRATATNIYDWTNDREIEPPVAPGITVQSLYDVGDVANFAAESGTDQLYIQKDGTVISRVKLTWDATDDEYVAASGQVDIEYKLSSDGENGWIKHPKLPGSATETYLTDLTDGEDYDFRIRFRNAFGKEGTFTAITDFTVEGKTEAPDPPTSFTATYVDGADRIDLEWTTPTDLDLSHTVIGRSVSLYQTLWENYSGFEYDLYDNGVSFPDGFSARKTQSTNPAFAYSKIKLFSFASGETLRVQFVYQRTSGSSSENPAIYGVNGTSRCTEAVEITAANLSTAYSQFIDLTVKSSSGTDANGSYVAGPCNGFVFANETSDTLNYTVTYFNARTYPDYQTIAEVPIGANRGQAITQKWSEPLVLKSDAARTHYYEIFTVDTSGNVSATKPRASARVAEWGRVQALSTAVSNNTVNITWNDSGSGGTVILQVLGTGFAEVYRVPESKGSQYIDQLGLNRTYAVRAWLERFFGGLPVISREIYTTFDIGSTPVPLVEPDYYYVRPPSP